MCLSSTVCRTQDEDPADTGILGTLHKPEKLRVNSVVQPRSPEFEPPVIQSPHRQPQPEHPDPLSTFTFMEYIWFQQEENNRRERDRAEERRLEQERWDKLITLQSKLAIDQETKRARETEEKTKLAEEREAARLLREEERLRKLTLAQNLPKLDSHKEDLHTFLQRFENIKNYEKVPVEEWVAYLTKIITGKSSILLTMQLTPDILASYPKTRDALLDYPIIITPNSSSIHPSPGTPPQSRSTMGSFQPSPSS